MHIIKGLPSECEYFKRSTSIEDEGFDLGVYKSKLLQEEAKIEVDKRLQPNSSGASAHWTKTQARGKSPEHDKGKWNTYRILKINQQAIRTHQEIQHGLEHHHVTAANG